MPFGIGHPPPTHQMQSTCVQEGSRVPNLQMEFNYLDLFKSCGIFSDFVVPMVPTLSPSSLCHPCHPHVIPVSFPSSPHHPHSPHVVPMAVVSVVSTPCCPCGPHVIPTSSPCHPHCPNIIPIVPRRSPCGHHGCGLCGLHPMLSQWSPCHPHHPHVVPVVPTSSRRSPHHP